ncbi:hypothetical protein IFM89_029915 [Coptis chinensis]|uniref:Uncharacterized protein n=1 Tax=Coptis chinensis TaxID=261450 RepID=A0A835HGB4_9MAGN|nr:hypothetical protein IFM89_029915 [Coptis chinensis]
MVIQKRLDYGYNGFQVPTIPKASRSARRKRSYKKKVEDNSMCAFELLATVAGNLLQERESTPISSNVSPEKLLQERESTPASSNVSSGRVQPTIVKDTIKKELLDEEKPLKLEPCDQGSSDESVFASEFGLQGSNKDRVPDNGICFEDSVFVKSRKETGKVTSKTKRCSAGCAESYKREVGAEAQKIGTLPNGNVPDTCSSEYPMDLDTKPPALVSSDSSVKVPLCTDPILHGPFPRYHDDVKLVSKDDDENSSGCTQPSTVTLKTFRAPPRIGDRRIRKLLASRYWKVAPKLKDGDLFNSDGDMKPVFRRRKTCYTRQRSQRSYPFKKRRLYEQSSVSTSYRGISSEGNSSSFKKVKDNELYFGGTANGASGASCSVAAQDSSSQSKDSHVKLSIKSFKIPELFIEIPESATVGSLKRTVMEAVTALLGGGLCVDVLLQGKKIRDNNKTLLQTGISHSNKLDGLGFSLEPNVVNSPPPLCPQDPPFLLHCEAQPLTRYPITPTSGISDASLTLNPAMNNFSNCVDSDHDSVPTPTDMSIDKVTLDSRALVAVPAMSVEALAAVPLNRKSRRSELAQRRIRRPFSVSEVEALVQAVEKLGTGRWRDVKLRAFDNAKHRTYVDLKDKWKTLVHTARISPQQRRGEPVPQELLDRVLAAHAYWSQQQAKQQVKPQTETCLLV